MKINQYTHLTFKNPSEITELYRSLKIDYPKFFKMDGICKLGFLASEIIFKEIENRFLPREDVAIISFNRSSSLDIDTQYQATIKDNDHYFPSPSLFVYTLPNIVNGEIAIRNNLFGETFFYLCAQFDEKQIFNTTKNIFNDKKVNMILVAWIEFFEEKHEVFMVLVEKENGNMKFTEKNLKKLYHT